MTSKVKPPEVHPVAALFPMLDGASLGELAESIRAEGLLHPIVLDSEGRVLDGRNRLAACKVAEVEPTFTTYEGDDPEAYALAVNIARRNLSKGQAAMIAARALLVSSNGQSATAAAIGVSQQRVSQANIVLEFASHLVEGVIAGREPFDDAYEKAKKAKKAKATEEDRLIAFANALGALDPGLRELVDGQKLTLDDAQKVAKLPNDIQVRVVAEHLTLVEADAILKQSEERLAAFDEKLRASLRTLGRMAGHPIPDGLPGRVSEQELAMLTTILDALDGGDYGFLG